MCHRACEEAEVGKQDDDVSWQIFSGRVDHLHDQAERLDISSPNKCSKKVMPAVEICQSKFRRKLANF